MHWNVGLGEGRGSSSRFCSVKILRVNNKGKGRFFPEFIVANKHSFVCLRKHWELRLRIEYSLKVFLSIFNYKCTLTLQRCETSALKIEYTGQRGGHLLKYFCSSGNELWLVYEDLLIEFDRTILLQNRDMAFQNKKKHWVYHKLSDQPFHSKEQVSSQKKERKVKFSCLLLRILRIFCEMAV